MDHTKAAFATVCGMDSKTLAVYVGRNKVIVKGDGMIDINHPVNKKFLEERLEKLKKKEHQEHETSVVNPQSEPGKAKIEALTLTQLTKERKISDLKKLAEEIELLTIKKEKQRGEIIPTELAKSIIYKQNSILMHRFKDHWEDHLSKLAHELRVRGDQIAKMRGEMVDHINRANVEAVEASKKEIGNIIGEFQRARSKGEKK